jgi:hypothetical protein
MSARAHHGISQRRDFENGRMVAAVSRPGYGGKIEWTQDEDGHKIKPPTPPCNSAVMLKIKRILPA